MRQKTTLSKDTKVGQISDLQLLTVADVAAILGLSRVKVFALLKQGPNRLPSLKIDGARRVQRKKLAVWIEQHAEQARRKAYLARVPPVGARHTSHFLGKGVLNHELTR